MDVYVYGEGLPLRTVRCWLMLGRLAVVDPGDGDVYNVHMHLDVNQLLYSNIYSRGGNRP